MVNIERLLTKKIMLLAHEHGKELSLEDVRERTDRVVEYLYAQGSPSERVNALELMLEMLVKWK